MSTETNTIELHGVSRDAYPQILTPAALEFVTSLQRKFGARRKDLLHDRAARLKRLNAGERPDFLPETRDIRTSEWTVATLPRDLLDRRVEITGPVDRKMIINALNSGAKVFMADFEDSTTPSWKNLLDGQVNLRDAIRRTIAYTDPKTGKEYVLGDHPAVLFIRPRGWHMDERHLTLGGEAFSGSLVDFGLYAFHNAKELLARGSGPYFYLPKLESHLEARLWNDVFVRTEALLGLPKGSIRATVLIETILASFEMDEILWELRDHSAGLNCGRWDYIFSYIKKFASDGSMLLPDRSQVTMTTHFMRSYSKLAIKTCHRRGVSAMGGMSAFIPIKNDPVANERALAKVRADKGARGDGRPRRYMGGSSGSGPYCDGGLRPHHARPQSDRQATDGLSRECRGSTSGTVRQHHRGRCATERGDRSRISGGMAARHRMRSPVSSDGGCGDRGD